MTNNYDGDERRGDALARPWERHAQTVLTGLVLAILLYFGNTINSNSKSIELMAVKLGYMTEKIEDLKTSVAKNMADRFTGREGHRMMGLLQKLEDRVRALENNP